MNRPCNAKIVATLGPASSSKEVIRALVAAGLDVAVQPVLPQRANLIVRGDTVHVFGGQSGGGS